MHKKKGYVYIFTNPSFRENWVKIGRSEREPDIRAKELYNTSVPLRFEIYATVKTSKYKELEQLIHNNLTNLGKRRVNDKREFFNIEPEEALNHLKDCAVLIDDAEFNIPDDSTATPDHEERKINSKSKNYTVSFKGPYYMKNDSIDAKMMVENSKYVVKEGSIISPELYSHIDIIRKHRDKFKDHLDNTQRTVVKDIHFSSPSVAAEFVRGGSSNGKYYWQTANNKKLGDYIVYDEQ